MAKNSGNYAVTVSNGDCAITSANVQVTIATPLAVGINLSEEIRIYPNPTDGLLVISTPQQKSNILSLRLLDIEGRILQTFDLSNQTGSQKSINVSRYPTGTYVLEMSGKDFEKRVKVLKN